MLSSTFPALGIQKDPGRAAQARSQGQRLHHPPGPQSAEDPSGAATEHRHDVAAVPAHSGRDDACRRFLPRGLRGDPAAPVLPIRHGGRHTLCAHSRCHREPGRGLDCAADPQPADGPGRPRRRLPVPGPRPGRAIHRRVRRSAGRCWYRGREDPAPMSSGETSGCILHLVGSMRAVVLLSWWRQ